MADKADFVRPSTAYRCATFGCDKQSVQVWTRYWNVNGQKGVGFYGDCAEHLHQS